ncbi:MAG TPA: hypothetical protein VIG30_13895 [Ktedonobacterales bacterium]
MRQLAHRDVHDIERRDAGPDADPSTPVCPFCGAADAELLSLFGSQLLTEQYYCRACHTPFEHVKDDQTADAQTK